MSLEAAFTFTCVSEYWTDKNLMGKTTFCVCVAEMETRMSLTSCGYRTQTSLTSGWCVLRVDMF
jgi:hypothetical protein